VNHSPEDVRASRVVSAVPIVVAIAVALVLPLTVTVSIWEALGLAWVIFVVLGVAVGVWERHRAWKAGFRPVKRHAFGYTTWKLRQP